MITRRMIFGIAGLGLLLAAAVAEAVAPPHSGPKNPQVCGTCHVSHNAAGAALGTVNGNANLCISCHTSGGTASNKPFSTAMQAVPGTSGGSHRWDGGMPLTSSPSNSYGLISTASVSNALI